MFDPRHALCECSVNAPCPVHGTGAICSRCGELVQARLVDDEGRCEACAEELQRAEVEAEEAAAIAELERIFVQHGLPASLAALVTPGTDPATALALARTVVVSCEDRALDEETADPELRAELAAVDFDLWVAHQEAQLERAA